MMKTLVHCSNSSSFRVNMVSGHVKTQLIAHDKEVYDIAFSKAGGGRDMFASVGADGRFKEQNYTLVHY